MRWSLTKQRRGVFHIPTHQHVESVDAEERRVPLTTRKHVQSRMAEPDVAHNIRRLEKRLQGRGPHEARHVVCKKRPTVTAQAIRSFSQSDSNEYSRAQPMLRRYLLKPTLARSLFTEKETHSAEAPSGQSAQFPLPRCILLP